ncbi:DUF2927 domain-containing protein [Roseivivax sp. CAU 1761]
MRRPLLLLALLLGACMPAAPEERASRAAPVIGEPAVLPAMKAFAPQPSDPVAGSNADLARDFLDLAFTLESGKALPVFTRFEEPIGVRVLGPAPDTLTGDLDRVLARLRREAGIDIARSGAPGASVTVQAVGRDAIRRVLPQAACFVVPNVSSFDEFRRHRHSARVSWSGLRSRDRVAIFVPGDSSPQEVRDCLHEELAQALGPLNDLYRLPDSVFNDDNVHTVLTGFDMLMLRLHYDPALRSGMRRDEVAARLPAILDRLNPAGRGGAATPLRPTPAAWVAAVQRALGTEGSHAERRAAARRAQQIALSEGWRDHRLGFAHYALGRLLTAEDPEAGMAEFARADTVFAAAPGGGLYRAYVAAQLAAHAIARNRPEVALARIAPHLDTVRRHENAALLATLLMLRAEALDLAGDAGAARQERLDSLGWARYGFGPDWAVRAKLREIGALNPQAEGIGRT